MNKLWVEQKLKIDPIIPFGYGTADAIVINGSTLHIVDLKYGTGVKVSAHENKQLMIYGWAALSALRKHYEIKDVVMHIVQPRLYHIDQYASTPEALHAFADEVFIAAERCINPNPEFNPTEKACQWCRAKAKCPALYRHNLEVVGDDFEVLPNPADLTDEQLDVVMRNKGLLEGWLKSIEAYIFSKIERGESFPGWKMVHGRSMRKYTDKAEAVLSEILGADAYDKKLKGIGAMEKLVGKKQFTELNITVKPDGKPVLVSEDDPRQSISQIVDDF